MAPQLHKRFSDEQIKSLLERYLSKDIGINYLLEILGIKRTRFFELLKAYRDDPHDFSISYRRKRTTRMMDRQIEENILRELGLEKTLIENRDMPNQVV